MASLSAAGRCSPLLPLAPHPLSDDSLHRMFAPSEDEEQEVEGEQDEEQEDKQEDKWEDKWEDKREDEREDKREDEREDEQEQEQEQEQDDDAFTDFLNGEPRKQERRKKGKTLTTLTMPPVLQRRGNLFENMGSNGGLNPCTR